MNPDAPGFIPPSEVLHLSDGIWSPQEVSAVSFPEHGNDVCYQVEDCSFWFAHRNKCLLQVIDQFPPAGTIYDVGGGNGFVAAALQTAGRPVVLVEPGSGASNAVQRGVRNVIGAALQDCGFRPQTLPAVGVFDVVEHIEDDQAFLTKIRDFLIPGGRFYATIPAFPALWSDEDVYAGHFRRYTPHSWTQVLNAAGFQVEYLTCFFAWLCAPAFLLRALPFQLRGSRAEQLGAVEDVKRDHQLPAGIRGAARLMQDWELNRIRQRKSIPVGTSLLTVAYKP